MFVTLDVSAEVGPGYSNLSPPTQPLTIYFSDFPGLMLAWIFIYDTFRYRGIISGRMNKIVFVPFGILDPTPCDRRPMSFSNYFYHIYLSGTFIKCLYSSIYPVSVFNAMLTEYCISDSGMICIFFFLAQFSCCLRERNLYLELVWLPTPGSIRCVPVVFRKGFTNTVSMSSGTISSSRGMKCIFFGLDLPFTLWSSFIFLRAILMGSFCSMWPYLSCMSLL